MMTDNSKQLSNGTAAAALAGVVLLVFGRSLGADLVWDDKNLILMNPWLRHGDTFWRTWTQDFWLLTNSSSHSGMFRPVVIDSYWLEYRLWGANSAGYHAANLLLHSMNSMLVFTIARRLKIAGTAALIGALFFALHPVQVEAAASVASRTDLLATLGILSACWLWLGSENSRKAAALPLFLALCSKESAVVGPLLLLLMDRRMGRPMFSKTSLWALAPWVPWLILRTQAVGLSTTGGALEEWTGGGRVFAYLLRIILPLPQGPITELAPLATSLAVTSGLVLVALALGLIFLNAKSRGVFAGQWILLALLPVSEIVPIGARYADLLLYLPMCGVAIGLAQVAEFSMQRSKQVARSSNLLPAVCALTFLLFGLTSFSWTGVWADDLSLWSYGVDSSPENVTANLNLGNALWSEGYRKEGCAQLKTALGLVEEQKQPGTAAKIVYNLGNCARDNEQWALAIQRYKESSRLSGGHFLPARFNLVTTYENSEQMQLALEESEHLIAEVGELARSWHLHGAILAKLGRYSEAIKAFDRALGIDPESQDSERFRLRAQELQEASTDIPDSP